MRIKKFYNSYTVLFEILNENIEINFEKELEDIFNSFEDTVLLDKTIPHQELMKLQQQSPRHILIDREVKVFDNLRLLLKFINNFLTVTGQSKDFIVDTLNSHGETEIIAYGSEIYYHSIKNITFSPTTRMKWSNPQLMNKIIDRG